MIEYDSKQVLKNTSNIGEIKVSFIVPVYKVEGYLERCVDSLLNQSYKNIEVILIDDGSPDSCPLMCDSYAAIDSRVKVIHKENGGLASAIKAGISISTGSYIGFVDSDDWVEKDVVFDCISKIDVYNVDLVMYDYFRASDICGKRTLDSLNMDGGLYNNFNLEKLKNTRARLLYTRWNKIYKRNLVEFTMQFYNTDISIGEDINFTAPIVDKVQSIYYLKKACMTYFINNGAMTQTYTQRYFSDYRKLYNSLEKYFGPNNQTLLFLDYRNMRGIIATIGRCKVINKKSILREVFQDKQTIENLELLKPCNLAYKDKVLRYFMLNRNIGILIIISKIFS